MKGLPVWVYRDSFGDSTNGGVSSTHNQLVLVGEGIAQVTESSEEHPAVRLLRRTIMGKEYLCAVPVESKGGTMFGGSFIHTSDSRFPNQYPIPVHDRVE